jgi:hypothetical protein
MELAVIISVIPNLMAFSRCARNQFGPPFDMTAKKEERSMYATFRQRVENERRSVGIWAVVERQ